MRTYVEYVFRKVEVSWKGLSERRCGYPRRKFFTKFVSEEEENIRGRPFERLNGTCRIMETAFTRSIFCSFVLRLNFLPVPPKRRGAKSVLLQAESLQDPVTGVRGGHSS